MTEERTTESPQKWWASGGDIPTINEVVERLRAEGNLDEEKWRRFEERTSLQSKKVFFYFVVISMMILWQSGISVLSILICTTLGALVLYEWRKTLSVVNSNTLYLYNFGEKVEGSLLNVRECFRVYVPALELTYSFKDDRGNIWRHTEYIMKKNINNEITHSIKENKNIAVLYNANYPEQSTIFFDSAAYKSFLRK